MNKIIKDKEKKENTEEIYEKSIIEEIKLFKKDFLIFGIIGIILLLLFLLKDTELLFSYMNNYTGQVSFIYYLLIYAYGFTLITYFTFLREKDYKPKKDATIFNTDIFEGRNMKINEIFALLGTPFLFLWFFSTLFYSNGGYNNDIQVYFKGETVRSMPHNETIEDISLKDVINTGKNIILNITDKYTSSFDICYRLKTDTNVTFDLDYCIKNDNFNKKTYKQMLEVKNQKIKKLGLDKYIIK